MQITKIQIGKEYAVWRNSYSVPRSPNRYGYNWFEKGKVIAKLGSGHYAEVRVEYPSGSVRTLKPRGVLSDWADFYAKNGEKIEQDRQKAEADKLEREKLAAQSARLHELWAMIEPDVDTTTFEMTKYNQVVAVNGVLLLDLLEENLMANDTIDKLLEQT